MFALLPVLLGVVQQFVPGIIGALAGSKAEAVSQKVVEVAQAVTGTSSQEDAATALRASPEAVLKLQESLAQVALQHAQAEFADRADARSMEVAAINKGSLIAWAPVVFTLVIMVPWAATMSGVAPHLSDADARSLQDILMFVLGFWFAGMPQGGGAGRPFSR